ncbi:Acetylcholine receptor subunit beta-type unc-29, partial [Exaiptasia diaphana]
QGYDLSHNKVKAEIRKHVLKDYDRIVGPVKYGDTQYLEVKFRLSITNLVEVNTKEQNLKIDAWVWQKWYDEFLAWNSTNFKKIGYTVFSPKEVWVPDIALINNADRTERLAGGPTKFVTNINAWRKGSMTWLSPATFSSTCVQNVKTWPMDVQNCILTFGSCTYPKKNLVIVPITETYTK